MRGMDEPKLKKRVQESILKDIQHGCFSTLDNLKAEQPNFHWRSIYYDKTGDTVLHIASRLGLSTIIDYLLEEYVPCTVNVRNKDDKTPLHEAAQFTQLESVLRLCSYGSDVNVLRRGDWTPLMLACTKIKPGVSLNIVKALVERGAKVNIPNKDGWTCIHLLARQGGEDILDYLINHGLKVDIKTNNSRTPLHIAALHGHIDILSKLVHFIDINAKDGCGNTPLHEAILGQQVDIAKWLVSHGADVDSRNNSDLSILHLAASHGSPKVIDYILTELNYNINCQNKNGWTVAHCAARNGSKDLLEHLKLLGADLSIKDDLGRTALDYFLS